jgi:hypothetical protein
MARSTLTVRLILAIISLIICAVVSMENGFADAASIQNESLRSDF